MKTVDTNKLRTTVKDYSLIVVGGILYAISTVLFIFPNGLLLDGHFVKYNI